jgi:oleandomycin transport system permease protein
LHGFLLVFRLATSIVHLIGITLLVLEFAISLSPVMALAGMMARAPKPLAGSASVIS